MVSALPCVEDSGVSDLLSFNAGLKVEVADANPLVASDLCWRLASVGGDVVVSAAANVTRLVNDRGSAIVENCVA